ncbi:hypothetical protein Mal64_00010 [Pseudobythopirellula maris]|uniref:Uncharacterized protein n=1 Tax=Pseudobythopirellula maris TaxID=2527991 RepID=A0A5C5ZQ57_9BACT|nr:hypothetical protein [Pseudobythopirellula maris]TWT89624.1 hypothetical protein Mal64_00010 [Pseudobythopirellula maris]
MKTLSTACLAGLAFASLANAQQLVQPQASDASFAYAPVSQVCCDEPSCCADPSCGCDDGCCGDGCCDPCGCGSSCSLLGECCLGEPFRLRDELLSSCSPWDFGMWTQIGYHSDRARASFADNDAL